MGGEVAELRRDRSGGRESVLNGSVGEGSWGKFQIRKTRKRSTIRVETNKVREGTRR